MEKSASASRLCRFTPGETVPTIHWVGSRVDVDVMEKEKSLAPIGNRTPAPWSSRL
jgi:hypothetical protein